MRPAAFLLVTTAATWLAACGTLEKKTALINRGDNKEAVVRIMGPPADRQFRGDQEAWQYCITGAGFGYHDFRIVWFHRGEVTGITSYKSGAPGVSCKSQFTPIRWDDAPAATIEVGHR